MYKRQALVLCFALLVRNKLLYYAVLFSPGLSLLFAGFFNDLFNSSIKKSYESFLRYTILILFLFLPVMNTFNNNLVNNYYFVQSEVINAVTPSDTIMGNQLYWFGLQENEYLSWENLVFDRRDRPGSDLESSFDQLRPDILIIDDQVRNFVFDNEDRGMYFQELSISKIELNDFLKKYATLETTIDKGFGIPIQVYRIHWNN